MTLNKKVSLIAVAAAGLAIVGGTFVSSAAMATDDGATTPEIDSSQITEMPTLEGMEGFDGATETESHNLNELPDANSPEAKAQAENFDWESMLFTQAEVAEYGFTPEDMASIAELTKSISDHWNDLDNVDIAELTDNSGEFDSEHLPSAEDLKN